MGEPEFPARPYIPPPFFGAVGALASAGIGMDAAWRAFLVYTNQTAGGAGAGVAIRSLVGMVPAARIVLPLVCLCAAGAWVLRRTGGWQSQEQRKSWRWYAARSLLWCAVCSTLGLIACTHHLVQRFEEYDTLAQMPLSSCELVVDEDASVSEFGANFAARVECDGDAVARVQLSAEEAYARGTRIEAVCRSSDLDDDPWDKSRFMDGTVANVSAVHVKRSEADADKPLVFHVRDVVLNRIDPSRSPARALVAGTVCGYTVDLNQASCSDAFDKTGLTHLVAVSGSHLALIAGVVETLLGRIGVRRGAVIAVVGTLMGSYVVFTGGAPSALRSLLMVMASMGAGLGGRRAHSVSGLSLTVVLLTFASPGIVHDLGFQLSAISVLFIGMFSRLISYHARTLRLGRYLASELSLTLSAQWATVPLTAGTFGQLSLVAPLANVVVAPVMTGLLAAGVLVAPFAYVIPDSGWLFAPAEVAAGTSIACAEVLAELPFSACATEGGWEIYALLWGSAVAAYLLWRPLRRSLLICSFLAVAGVFGGYLAYWELLAPPALIVLDVGQADCILLRDGSSTLLVDAGEDEAALSALARNHVSSLDAVVLTHWHADHYGGLADIAELVDIGAVYVAEGTLEHAPADAREALDEVGMERVHELACGEGLQVGGFSCRMVLPAEPVDGLENEDSLCLKVSYDSSDAHMDAFLTGDAESPVTEEVADAVGDVDVLKLGHHGSEVSVSDELLDALDPELCVASAGEGNSYGHPDPVCCRLVEQSGARMLCTKDVGDVALEPTARGVCVICAHEPASAAAFRRASGYPDSAVLLGGLSVRQAAGGRSAPLPYNGSSSKVRIGAKAVTVWRRRCFFRSIWS